MNVQEVCALVGLIRSDASKQIAGFIYQFVVALDYCFKLSSGQSLYIEKYGDIALKEDGSFDNDCQDISVEVKFYSKEMDACHHNLLNTLYNWLDDDFNFEGYQTLVIYTTQPFSKGSPLEGWNEKSTEDKIDIVTSAYINYLKTKKDKIENKEATKYGTIKSNASKMTRVLYSIRSEDGKIDEVASRKRLESLLKRVIIIDSCKNLNQSYNDLFKYAKMVKESLQETFINSLLGFIISPPNMLNGWKIDYDSFTGEVQRLAKVMSPQVISFPEAPDVDVKQGDYDDALFVLKLKDIDYNRITEAVIDFAKTTGLLTKEFSRTLAEKNLSEYQEEILQMYRLKYDNAMDELNNVDEMSDELIKKASRIFLRQMLQDARQPLFQPFGRTKPYFSNGMCHFMANDKEQGVKWLLKDE
jgi:hypothetical protein